MRTPAQRHRSHEDVGMLKIVYPPSPQGCERAKFVFLASIQSMAETVQDATPGPAVAGDEHAAQKKPPSPPLEAEAVPRNEKLEAAIRTNLEGPDKDLGRMCRALGENFCLAPPRPKAARASGYDSGSDTTSPADQDQSSSGSETGGDHAGVSGGAAQSDDGCRSSGDDDHDDEVLQAVASAGRVRVAEGVESEVSWYPGYVILVTWQSIAQQMLTDFLLCRDCACYFQNQVQIRARITRF